MIMVRYSTRPQKEASCSAKASENVANIESNTIAAITTDAATVIENLLFVNLKNDDLRGITTIPQA